MSDDTGPCDVPATGGDRPALPGRLAQRYVLEDLIGRGTCSEVYRARDVLLDRAAAVKVFPMDGARSTREVSLLASLDHPSLVAIYDVGEADGRAFVVMTLLEGGNLVDRLAHGPLPVADTLLAVAAVADGLGHVHRAGVLHRDVTPRNVLFDVDGRAHLSDFGVALVVDAPRITDTGIVEGSAPYLAPEQVRGEAVGAPADVYSLGLVMIEALTGRPAYAGTPLAAATARLEHRPEMPRGIDPDVVALLTAMTADDPADRPGADDVCVGLRRAALAAETSATIVPVAPVAGVGLACAVDSATAGLPSLVAMTPAVGTTAAAAVAVPVAAAARRSGPESDTVVSPVVATETPFDVRTRSAGAELAANARGLVVVGSVLASIVLAGGVVFASAWTVDSTSAAEPPYATVPPSTAEIAGAPDTGGAPGDSGSSSGSTSEDSTDGGSARAVYRDRSADDDDEAPSRSRSSSSEPTEADRRTGDTVTSRTGTSSASSPTESRSDATVPSPPSVSDLPSLPDLPTVPGPPTDTSVLPSVPGPPIDTSVLPSVPGLPTGSTTPSPTSPTTAAPTSSAGAPTSSTAAPTTTTTTTTTTAPVTRRADGRTAGDPSLEALGDLLGL